MTATAMSETVTTKPQIAEACLYRIPDAEGTVLLDFRETGAFGWETCLASTPQDLLVLGYVQMEDPERGDEYRIPANPRNENSTLVIQDGILWAPQAAAILLQFHDGHEDYEPKKPASANDVTVPSEAEADLIIRSFRFPAK